MESQAPVAAFQKAQAEFVKTHEDLLQSHNQQVEEITNLQARLSDITKQYKKLSLSSVSNLCPLPSALKVIG